MTAKRQNKQAAVAVGDVVYYVKPLSFGIEVGKVKEVIIRHTLAGERVEYLVKNENKLDYSVGSDHLIFNNLSHLKTHIENVAKNQVDKVIEAVDVRAQKLERAEAESVKKHEDV